MITQYRPSYYQAPRAPSFAGRSIDDKPLNVENGSTFKEIDTGRVFRYDKENNVWIEQRGATPVQPAKPEQAKTVDLNMATGNQTVLPDEGKILSSATIIKPDTMIPANIKVGVNIGGVVGTAPTPKTEQTKTVTLSMPTGNQTVTPDSGKVLTSVTVTKPDTLVAGNIKSGVDIGGVTGALTPAKAEQVKTVDLAMAAGNQTISSDSGKVLSSVVVTKPTTLIAGNVKKGVNIGGVIGTLEEGTSVKEPYIEETYDEQGNLTGAVMHGYTKIRGYLFAGCTSLALTSLPISITSIEGGAFRGCSKLALTSLPSGITSIDTDAFQNCTGLTSITFEGTPTSIASVFDGCTNLTSIKVPWAEGAVAGAPWGATNATITYNYTA